MTILWKNYKKKESNSLRRIARKYDKALEYLKRLLTIQQEIGDKKSEGFDERDESTKASNCIY